MPEGVLEVDAAGWGEGVLRSDTPVVVDFWHENCGWCIKLEPVFEEVSREYGSGLKFVKLNVLASAENREIAVKHGVMGTPTIKLFCEGRDVGEIVGFLVKEQLRDEIDRILERSEDCLEKSSSFPS